VRERDSVSALAQILAALRIDWVLFGALAANLYRITTRTTQDVDLLLLDAGPGIEALEGEFHRAGWSIRRAAAEGDILRARHPTYGLADLIIAGTQYERDAIARARTEDVSPQLAVRVLAPEDVIVFKLIAGRAQDIADVEAILAAKPVLDESYLEMWAAAWDILELWRRLRSATP
jgi:hypothetical protein